MYKKKVRHPYSSFTAKSWMSAIRKRGKSVNSGEYDFVSYSGWVTYSLQLLEPPQELYGQALIWKNFTWYDELHFIGLYTEKTIDVFTHNLLTAYYLLLGIQLEIENSQNTIHFVLDICSPLNLTCLRGPSGGNKLVCLPVCTCESQFLAPTLQ